MDLFTILRTVVRTLSKLRKGEVSYHEVWKSFKEKVYRRLDRIEKSNSFRIDRFQKFNYSKKEYFDDYLKETHEGEIRKFFKRVNIKGAKGIIIYPHAINWEPVQRPQHLLRELGKKGFVCFFCVGDEHGDLQVKEVFKNVYTVNREDILIEAFRNYQVIIYMTWIGQVLFTEFFPNKFVWYDIVDSFKTFDFGKQISAKTLHKKFLKTSNLLTYSAKSLAPGDKRAIFVPNGVDLKLFRKSDSTVKRNGIIYVGAIDNQWFDWESLIYAARELPREKFYLVGKVSKSHPHLPSNVKKVGFLKQDELPEYLKKMKIGIIPFKKNHITDFVLPLKMFEYLTGGIPVVAKGLRELDSFKEEYIVNTNSKREFLEQIQEKLTHDYDADDMYGVASEYSWEKNISKIEDALRVNVSGLKALANLETVDLVNIITNTFYDSEGKNFFSGGAERYLIDLEEICRNLGYKMRILQKGSYNWVRYYDNQLEVVGVSNFESLHIYDDSHLSKMAYYLTAGRSPINVYSPFLLASPFNISPSIGISHGIFWDHPNANGCLDFSLLEAAKKVDSFVSVDTNTCNWFQTKDYKLGQSIKYVPNYVDTKEFSGSKKGDPIVITYPRRLYKPRGLYIVLDVVDRILSSFDNVEFHFVGKGFDEDTKNIEKYVKKWGKKVQWYSMDPKDMHKVYKNTTISLIPTLFSEGTSLSCLEALSSGNIVIATRVGGLTDLILNRFNGFLIEPNSDSLYRTLTDILGKLSEYESIKRNAVATAKAFEKKYWAESWKEILSKYIEKEKKNTNITNEQINFSYKSKREFFKNIDKVSKELELGKTVFIKIPEKEISCKESFGRLQFVDSLE